LDEPGRRIILIPGAKSAGCPACRQQIHSWWWSAGEFFCPHCRIGLRLRKAYFKTLYAIAVVLVILLADLLGLKGSGLMGVALFALFPTYWLVVFVTLRVFPVDLETTADVRGILHGPPEPPLTDEEDELTFVAFERIDETSDKQEPQGQVAAPTFQFVKSSLGIHGVFLLLLAAAVAGYAAWSAGAALLVRFWPTITETRTAPRGFGLSAELGENGIAFFNPSRETWACNVAIGFSLTSKYRALFGLNAGETRSIGYPAFGSSVAPAALRAVAREQLFAECVADSGRHHSGALR
jgi:hypothetical protein